MEDTKDIEIGGSKYQIGRFRARDGSWILMQILTKMLPSSVEAPFSSQSGAKLSSHRAQISEEEFANIQSHCLAVCRRYENGVPMPVFVRPDTWAVKELEYDVVTVMALTVHSLTFNLAPFFQGDGLSQILATLPGLVPISPPSQP